MQELNFVPDDSDPDSLVLRDEAGDVTFVLPVTDELRDFLAPEQDTGQDAGQDTAADTGADTAPEQPTTPSLSVSRLDAPAAASRPERVHLRPRDIQDRIRHGAAVADLVAETGMQERRVEAFARPVLMERARLADLAHRARPVLSDGPSHATLWEVLATAFAGRGEDLRQASWDAALNPSDEWIVTVTWQKGNKDDGAEFTAEFRWTQSTGSAALVSPVNSVAIELVDPRMPTAGRPSSPSAAETTPDTPVVRDSDVTAIDGWGRSDADESPADRADDTAGAADGDAEVSFLQHPGAESGNHPAGRRRKASTPHWEDVLLGVRPKPGKKK
jgi:hypothetical protein